MIPCYSCASFIASHFGGLGILHLVLYFHIALETTSHSRFPGIFFLLLGVLFFLQQKITTLFAIFYIWQLKPEQFYPQVFKFPPANEIFC